MNNWVEIMQGEITKLSLQLTTIMILSEWVIRLFK